MPTPRRPGLSGLVSEQSDDERCREGLEVRRGSGDPISYRPSFRVNEPQVVSTSQVGDDCSVVVFGSGLTAVLPASPAQGSESPTVSDFGVGITSPFGITEGSDGAMWFTNPEKGSGDDSIGRISISGAVTDTPESVSTSPRNHLRGRWGLVVHQLRQRQRSGGSPSLRPEALPLATRHRRRRCGKPTGHRLQGRGP